MKKISEKPVWSKKGFNIYVKTKKSKTGKGKDRVWIGIRQTTPKSKRYRVAANLSYSQGVDIVFESK